MTIQEIDAGLPNGLHDAELLRIDIDYTQRKLVLSLDVWVGALSGDIKKREAYRKARIEVRGLQFAAIEPPDANYPYSDPVPSRIDICDLRKNLDENLLKSLPSETFFNSLWVNKWNAFAHIAAVEAELVWEDDKATYRAHREHYLPGEMIEQQ